jgi:hypothetical protein
MRLIRKLLLILLAFIAMVLGLAFFIPAEFKVEASIDVNQSVTETKNEFSDPDTWKEWTNWKINDSAKTDETNLAFIPVPGMGDAGFSGKLYQFKPVEVISEEHWSFEAGETGSKINWKSTGSLSYPLGRIYGLVFSDFRRSEMEAQLDSLRNFLESSIDVPPTPLDQPATLQPE